MPQYDMILLSNEEAAEMERRGAKIEVHVAGSVVREGGGEETYRCGGCRTRLLSSVAHHDAHGAIIRCGKCGRVNIEPHHH
jgi:predicted SprT family Zn-dependent metalloprotease